MHRTVLAFLLALLLAPCLAGAQPAAAPKASSAFNRLDPRLLAERLSALGMRELLDAYLVEQKAAGGGQASTTDMALLAQDKLDSAANAADPAERDKLYEEASALYAQIIEAATKAGTEEKRLESFDARLKQAEVSGWIRCLPYADRLLFLHGAAEDRNAVAALTAEPVASLRKLQDDCKNTAVGYREDRKKLMTYMSDLDSFSDKLAWRAAWIDLYRAMALTDPNAAGERKTLLNEAQEGAKRFCKRTDDTGIVFDAYLLLGDSLREQKQFDPAADAFKKAGADGAPAATRMIARFGAVRACIEQGKADQVPAAIADYVKLCGELAPQETMLTDLKAVLLTSYLHDTAAAAATDKAKAAEEYALTEKALLEFTRKYAEPAQLETLTRIIGLKCRDRTDYDNLGALSLAALARQVKEAKTPEAYTLAGSLLDQAVARTDSTSVEARPIALWDMAMLAYDQRDFVKAGACFNDLADLGKKFPDNKLIPQATQNAVAVFEEAVRDAAERKQSVPKEVRLSYVKALETLLSMSGDKPEIQNYFYDLGVQRQRLALVTDGNEHKENLAKAVEALAKVPPAASRYMEAHLTGFQVMRDQLQEAAAAEQKALAQGLVEKLAAYAQQARKAAESEADKAKGAQIKEWGAQAALDAAELRFDSLDQKDAAVADAEKIPQDWPGTPAVQQAQGWVINTLVSSHDSAKMAQAIQRAKEFRKTYSFKEAEALIGQVVKSIRDRIGEVRKSDRATQDLGDLQKSYLEFAGELYKSTDANASPESTYALRQMYADALVEGGLAKDALGLWQQCQKEDELRRAQAAKAIEEEFQKNLQAVQQVAEANELKSLAEAYLHRLDEERISRDDSSHARAVARTMAALAQASDGDAGPQLAELRKKVMEGLTALRDHLKARVDTDVTNVLGFARCQRALGQHKEAIKLYSEVARGLDRETSGDLFWQVQEEYYGEMLEASRSDPENLRKILVSMTDLRRLDENMGGRAGRFNQMEAEIRKATGP